ncbi:protein kinase, partial [Salmonella sp. SAL4358]|uniref:protein kinase n=1 Tax=Salmonella sp. SAL4358 TaxID=3159879 RepID=UPI00397CA06A
AVQRAPQGRWTLRQLIGILERASQGVGYAHARGVVHGDIEASRILIGAFGEVVILDWGLNSVKDAPADVYALGSTLLHILA